MEFYSQHEQDKILYDVLFKNKKEPGFFLDIGAYDGVNISNTLFYERFLNWSGICIEPLPDRFKLLKENRKAIYIEGAISNNDGTEEFIIFPEYTDMLCGLKNTYNPNIKSIIDGKIAENKHASKIIQVNTYNINNLLEKHKVNHIDYVSLDTEGSELSILKSWDLEKYPVQAFSIENNNYDKSIYNFMKSKGYKLITIVECDEIYKKI